MSEKKGCEKMSQKHQKSQARSISVNAIAEKPLLIWDYVAFAAIAVFCFSFSAVRSFAYGRLQLRLFKWSFP